MPAGAGRHQLHSSSTATTCGSWRGRGGAVSVSRAVGIDLGTAHCALSSLEREASVDDDAASALHTQEVRVVAPRAGRSARALAVVRTLPHPDELTEGALVLPAPSTTRDCAVGEGARSSA